MTIEILMPALSPTMTEGRLAAWLVKTGDHIKCGDVIAEIETDKATIEIEAFDEGVLGKILVDAGTESVSVNSVIAILLENDEDETALNLPSSEVKNIKIISPLPSNVASTVQKLSSGKRLAASPLAKRIAEKEGVDIANIHGSGPKGRVVKIDIENFLANRTPGPSKIKLEPTLKSDLSDQDYVEVPNSSTRKIIARRLSESKRNIPHFYLTLDCCVDKLLSLRKKLNMVENADYKISVNDFILRAVALALKKSPAVNASWTDHSIHQLNNIDISVAVATEGGLITPIIRKADSKGLSVISSEVRELAFRAREGRLMPNEYEGGSITVSNLGMFGIKEFAAIINPPQSSILAVGAAIRQPVVNSHDEIEVATVMSCTLSADHRIVDGAVGAKFLAQFKSFIEEPLTMLL